MNLKTISKDITTEEQIKQVAIISANNDVEIGNLVSAAMNKVGRDGIVTVEESRTGETSLEVVEGLQFERGYKSPYFVTDNNTMSAVLKDPFVLSMTRKLQLQKIYSKYLQRNFN
jgi:chaperonin GroEL